VADPQLRNWLDGAIGKLPVPDFARKEFVVLRKKFGMITQGDAASNQVAAYYRQWFDELKSIPPAGRSVGLYQDLSSAYVLGKQLDKLPQAEAPGQDPSKVAQQFMLVCL
jgi:hypothetical protein